MVVRRAPARYAARRRAELSSIFVEEPEGLFG